MLRIIKQILLLVGLLLAFAAAAAENTACIAVATDAPGPEATISEKAARCGYFLLFDCYGHFLAEKRNPVADVSSGAGPKVARFLSNNGVSLVIAGEVGSKMAKSLDLYKIKYLQRMGVAHEVVHAAIDKK